jgi:hypothetical protein
MIEPTMKPGLKAASVPRFKRWLLAAALCAGPLLSVASPALAQEDEVKHDGRLDGYTGPVSVENQSTALIWLLFVFLGVVALAGLFKDAKRTHLD